MAVEIERKFLVKDSSYKELAKGILYRQGYLSLSVDTTVRVRIVAERAFLTIKGSNQGISRLEYEYELPIKDADEIINKLCIKPIIEKYRYRIEYKGHIWEVDEFIGDNTGLVIAEIELRNECEKFVKPDFIGDEVTGDYRYYNSNLINNPYKRWK